MRCTCVRRIGFIAALVLFGHVNTVLAQERVESNVVYGMHSGTALLMDIHTPAEPNGHGIIVIAGSGWHSAGDYDAGQLKNRALAPGMGGTELLNAGYTLFTINHRAAPRFRFPAAVEDAKRAVRFVRHNAERFGIDPDRIGAIGSSSGGHLSAMLGVVDATSDAENKPDGVEAQSSQVQAVVAYCPATDLVGFSVDGEGRHDVASSFIGAPYTFVSPRVDALYREASPVSHVSKGDAPMLLVHGDADSQVPYQQSETLRDKLRSAGVKTRLIRIVGGEHLNTGHGFTSPDGNTPDYLAPTVEWFDNHLQVEK